ncbi:MAG: FAD-binding oxidoreductase [Candidatus Accumulibacter sp.]|jgi:FAD/FMN-containing dehydrogenase|nr:FAD-binding oxidoreductase [Accumulibacter sp.]
MKPVSSWGRLDAHFHQLVGLYDAGGVGDILSRKNPGIAYGMGRSYGDVCLNPGGLLWVTTGLDRFIAFDEETGVLTCEAGVLLEEIQKIFIPRGWTLPVTPGTLQITVGGAIANDVHGKNHHVEGSFGDHVRRVRLTRTDGETIEAGPDLQPDWFAATVGGMGLTGVIVEAEIRLKPIKGPWLDAETIPYENLDEFFELADASEADWEHTVSWIDGLSGKFGRGIFLRANPVEAFQREPRAWAVSVPFTPPFSLANPLAMRCFNSAYYEFKKRRAGRSVAHCDAFLYPLDCIREWNRVYGPSGFFQYQLVVPRETGKDAVQTALNEIVLAQEGSFLAVLKTFGARDAVGMMSFPRPGVTLAMDFPSRGERTHRLFEKLDAIVQNAGGRLYPAKDARMPRALFEAGYPRVEEFLKYRDAGISSGLSRRLMGI